MTSAMCIRRALHTIDTETKGIRLSKIAPMLGAQWKRARTQIRSGPRRAVKQGRVTTIQVVRLAGFEPTTPWFVAKYSIQLSYSRTVKQKTSTTHRDADA